MNWNMNMESSSIIGELRNNTVPASKWKRYALGFSSVQYVLVLQFLDRLPGPQSLKTIKNDKELKNFEFLAKTLKQFISRQIIQSITEKKHIKSILQNWKTWSRGETKRKLKMMPYLRNNKFMNNAPLSIVNGDLMRWNRRRTAVSPGGDVDGCLELS